MQAVSCKKQSERKMRSFDEKTDKMAGSYKNMYQENVVLCGSSAYTKKYYLNEMIEFYGGRAAEEIVFGKDQITTGASSDIRRASAIARFMVTQIGMTEKFGPILLDGTQDGDMFQRKYYSEETGKEIDDEVRRLLNEAYQRAINILNTHRNKLEAVTKVLLEKETIMGPEFEAIMEDENI